MGVAAISSGLEGAVIVDDATWTPSKRPQFETAEVDGSWSGDSGHTTPTRSSTPKGGFAAAQETFGSPGKTTPRARSPMLHADLDLDLEQTPRLQQLEFFVRPHRGSL